MLIENIVVSVNGEAHAVETIKYAICLAKHFNSQLHVVYVVNKKPIGFLLKHRIFVESEAKQYEEELTSFGTAFLERMKHLAETKDIKIVKYLLNGFVHEELINKVTEISADLLVIGGPGEKSLRSEGFYDEGTMIIWKSPCPVVVVKNPRMAEKCYREL